MAGASLLGQVQYQTIYSGTPFLVVRLVVIVGVGESWK